MQHNRPTGQEKAMFDAGNDVVTFCRKVRRMGGSTDVSFGSPTNEKIGGRYLSVNEAAERGLRAGDALTVYARACPRTESEYAALASMGERLEYGVMVTLTYSPEAVMLLALAGCKLNDYGSLLTAHVDDLRAVAQVHIDAFTRPDATS
jgi:hypothetical protein